ncbi:ABC transporter substrate-binding protein [Streptomyces fulvoviolaceus]|uniref:ABC transporter substrate-binding protein n=1 Tax=Streptomyces fulvoviolaceus TaxID=285535 RepID=UPI0021BFC31A|nr:ABC transporter substrate-binding protein [Streptomyces fulvoviolaceus]MCT9077392.1 ABC transporter substrate-binding protein [Streptomyces fulvoviolaceus]
MPSNFSRRRLLATGAGVALGGAATAVATSAQGATPVGASSLTGVREETRSLDELYEAAIAEGGKLVLYQGGDVDSQAAGVRAGWAARFPEVELTAVVDYSKYHDVRVDNQLATDTLVPDVVQLQTLQDFTRWKREGRLLRYKPAGFSEVHKGFKDPEGAWTAIAVIGFSFLYNIQAAGANAPRTPQDLVDPRWKDAIASSYPHDDDAVLFLFSLYQQKYGWDWVADFAAQQPQFARGSHTPGLAVGGKQKTIGVGTSGSAVSTSTTTKWVVPESAPFMAWGQRAAILKQSAHPAAAKLYVNWMLSEERQKASFNGWSVRTDVTPNASLKPVWEFPNANVDGFPRFMEDRAVIERLKQTFALYFGEVKGDPSPGWLGLHPGA